MLAAFLRFSRLGLEGWHRWGPLVVVAGLTVAQVSIAHQSVAMTDAVVLLAVIPAAIAAFADSFFEGLLLGFTGCNSLFRVVIQAA